MQSHCLSFLFYLLEILNIEGEQSWDDFKTYYKSCNNQDSVILAKEQTE